MYVARILYPVEVLGPGKRIGIWFCGCPHRCKGCSNPELWELDEKYRTNIDTICLLLSEIAKHNKVEGITITGGEPFYQASELLALLPKVRTISDDILVYSGYTLAELRKFDESEQVLSQISCLVDGRYIEEQNNRRFFFGSNNQNVYVFMDHLTNVYTDYLVKEKCEIQNFMSCDGIISVGIHRPKFDSDFRESAMASGLEETVD
jgi:anaerobic ribonucleoside-triphosphate reductase activating protein